VKWRTTRAVPAELRRVPRAVVLEAHVGVDLDDQQRRGGRSVDESPETVPVTERRVEPASTRYTEVPLKAIVATDQAAEAAGITLAQRPEPTPAINDVVVERRRRTRRRTRAGRRPRTTARAACWCSGDGRAALGRYRDGDATGHAGLLRASGRFRRRRDPADRPRPVPLLPPPTLTNRSNQLPDLSKPATGRAPTAAVAPGRSSSTGQACGRCRATDRPAPTSNGPSSDPPPTHRFRPPRRPRDPLRLNPDRWSSPAGHACRDPCTATFPTANSTAAANPETPGAAYTRIPSRSPLPGPCPATAPSTARRPLRLRCPVVLGPRSNRIWPGR
jgi:hypothetical protein